MIAMKGEVFITSAYYAMKLIKRNFVRIGTMNVISEFVVMLGKVFVTAFCVTTLYLWLDFAPEFQHGGERELSSQWLPLLICSILSFFVASGFFYV